MYQQIVNPMGCERIEHEAWNHMDFIYGMDVNPLFNEKVIKFLQSASDEPDFIQLQIQEALRQRSETPPPLSEPIGEEQHRNQSKLRELPYKGKKCEKS